ncbi:uncharacterized protein LOC134203545 isoform X3 [Armigeres subalbatus]|uniref:uncharacterized protein LOC134203545 isoform X3 n=1 Tax=Armigeres subalbatus TaxID=124917 RepID=UPI002ED0A9C2
MHRISAEWEEWLRAFELLLELKQVDSQHERLILMLARGGRGLQRIYFNLRPVPGEIQPGPAKVPLAPQETPEYDNAVKRLNNFFVGKRNERVELEVFRSLKQSTEESFNNFILKLRTQANRCDFREREEKEILQQVTMGARDDRVRDKGLENVMNLDELTNYAVNRELLAKQKEKSHPFKVDAEPVSVSAVKQVWGRKYQPRERSFGTTVYKSEKPWNDGNRTRLECDRCGSWKHHKDSPSCIARNSKCNNCGRTGHFARKCRAARKKQLKSRSTWRRTEDEANALRYDCGEIEALQHRPTSEESLKSPPRTRTHQKET